MGENIYFISERPAIANHAGNKARIDVEEILSAMNFQPAVHIEERDFSSKFQYYKYILSPAYIKKIFTLSRLRGHILIMQYPFYYNKRINQCLRQVIRENRTILIIHDSFILRHLKNKKESIEKELKCFNEAEVLIVHNRYMQKKLHQLGITTPMIELKLFDYLLPNNVISHQLKERRLKKEIDFAGNLAKSIYLQKEEISQLGLLFNVYGPNFSDELIPWKNIQYQGSFSPEEIPYQLKGSFGLIWDGPSIDTCAGADGQYMRYNNPHKLSLYIAANLPVVTWEKAAIADFIDYYNIGFCVDSLSKIEGKILQLTNEDYKTYIQNIQKLRKRIISGYFMRNAVQRALEKIY